MPKSTIGKYTHKPYRCTECKNEREIGTNHWGECYPVCPVCRKQTVHECLEPLPEGMAKPEPWKMVKLGDVAEIKVVKSKGIGHVR